MDIVAILVMWPEPFEQALVPPSQGGSTWNLASISPVVIEEKKFKNIESCEMWTKVSEWLTSCTHLVDCIDYIYQLSYHRLQ